MFYFLYFCFWYIIDIFLNLIFFSLLDLTIYLLNHPLMSSDEKKKLMLHFYFFKEVEERKKKIKFTKFNDFYFSIRFINFFINNDSFKFKLINFFYKLNKFFYTFGWSIYNCLYFDFFFFFTVKFHLEYYQKSLKNYFIIFLFWFFSLIYNRFNLNIKFFLLNLCIDIVIEIFLALLYFLNFFFHSFFQFNPYFNLFGPISENKDNLLFLSRIYLIFLLKSFLNFILKITFTEKIFKFLFEFFYFNFLLHIIYILNIFIRNHYALGFIIYSLFMIFFLVIYFFIYIFFLFFSFIFLFFSFFFFIFLCTLNFDLVAFVQFDIKAFLINFRETRDLYKKLALVFYYNYKEFLLGDDFRSFTFSFRKFVLLCIFFTGYFYYFCLFVIIFFFCILFLLFIFSFLRPFLECLHKTLNTYSKRADQIIWNETLLKFFSSFITNVGLLKFSFNIFNQQSIVKLIDFWLVFYIDGLESFCSKPTWFYIFSDFILIFERLVFFYDVNLGIYWLASNILPAKSQIFKIDPPLKLSFFSRLKKDFIDIFRYIFAGWTFINLYAVRDMIMEKLLPEDALEQFREEVKEKDLQLEKTSNFNKFFKSLSFMITFVWRHKYFSLMFIYVFKFKLPITVFSIAYKFHDYLFKHVLYLRIDSID